MSVSENLKRIKAELPSKVTLVAVTKTKPVELIMEAYHTGHNVFGENKVQELVSKYEVLPKDIDWHMIGHLQRNKVKYLAPFVSLIHGVDSLKLLRAINKEALKVQRVIPCLLQVHIADEDTKFGFSPDEVKQLFYNEEINSLKNVQVKGLMGMATFTDDSRKVSGEFATLKQLFDEAKALFFKDKIYFDKLSMGMSGDFRLAIEQGSNMVRIGSAIFGERETGNKAQS